MKYIPSKDQEHLGMAARYVDDGEVEGLSESTVSAEVFEMILREIHNTIELSGTEPSHDDLQQLYQAITSASMKWSKDIDYINPTLVLSNTGTLYSLIKPSGPNVVLPNKSIVGSKNPVESPEYWHKFTIAVDTNIVELADELTSLIDRLDVLEPQVTTSVNAAIQPLITMHTNNGIATNTKACHAKPGLATDITSDGNLFVDVDNRTVVIEDNKVKVNETEIVPRTASSTRSGIVIADKGLTMIDSSLTVSDHASNLHEYGVGNYQLYGHLKLTDDYEQGTGASEGVGVSPLGLQTMKNDVLGIVSTTTITSSRTWVVPETAKYQIVLVGGGGNGGSGGNGAFNMCNLSDGGTRHYVSGAGGGGGGAGETITTTVTLTKGTSINVVIGGSGGGATSFGTHATARGGGNGGRGNNSSINSSCSPTRGSGGTLGTNYGTGGTNGGAGIYINGGYGCKPAVPAGAGGTGGRSIQGTYGHGGNGGKGQTNTQACKDSLAGPYGGAAGTQGVCIITLSLQG